jgi:Spy/CpxP family protein refolding chaperone
MTVLKVKSCVAAALVVVMLGSAVLAAADEQRQSGWATHEHGPGDDMFGAGFFGPGAFGRMGDELGLTAEQRQSIRAVLDAARPQMQTLRDSMHSNMEKLRGVQPDDPNYANVVAQVSQSAADLASRLVTEGSQVRSQVYGLLTKEQKAKLPQIEAQMKDEAHQRFQHHRPPSGAPSSDSSSTPST